MNRTEPPTLLHPYDFYLWALTLSDSRTQGWPLVDSPLPTIGCTLMYLFIVWSGPKLMRNRKPINLTWLMVPYNLAMAALNAYIAIQLFTASFRLRYNYLCQPCINKNLPDDLQVADAVWWFYFSKLLEFSDTIFFILRKKENQLTFLHVYHHSTMFPLWWIGTKWVPCGSTFLPAMGNSLIHVLMYTYYGLAACGSRFMKYLWWKKYLTILQLFQFASGVVLGLNGLRTGCEFPVWMQYMVVFYMGSFMVLFGNFYIREYIAYDRQLRKNNESVRMIDKIGAIGGSGSAKVKTS